MPGTDLQSSVSPKLLAQSAMPNRVYDDPTCAECNEKEMAVTSSSQFDIPVQGYVNDPQLLPGLYNLEIDGDAERDHLLSFDNVRNASGLDELALSRAIEAGQFPRPYETRGARRKVWKSSDIQRWIATSQA